MEIKEEKKNSKVKIVIFLLIIVALVAIVGFAYARYITKLNGTTTADIAQWSFKVNGKTNENFVIDLASTRTGIAQEAEVQEGYIGPGTAGAFQLVLDATGSEASLEYDINMNVDYINNEAFPKNLIFYTDSTMQNAIYHTDNNINLNGFIGWNDGSKIHTKTIYWKWDYETGSTQNEISSNDELDSYWMGKPITLSMNVTAKQVNENPTTGQYAVTLDANGGTIQGYGNSSQATKMVTYGETYGNLPEPKREGYTFLGWNGKNLFDEQTLFRSVENSSYEDGYYVFNVHNFYLKFKDGIKTISFNDNTKYTMTIQGYTYGPNENGNNGKTNLRFIIKYTDGSEDTLWLQKTNAKISFTSDAGKTIADVYAYYGYSGTVYISKMQIEKSSISTAYEPYYITSSTEVVQNQNHTLTAIWVPTTNSNS